MGTGIGREPTESRQRRGTGKKKRRMINKAALGLSDQRMPGGGADSKGLVMSPSVNLKSKLRAKKRMLEMW